MVTWNALLHGSAKHLEVARWEREMKNEWKRNNGKRRVTYENRLREGRNGEGDKEEGKDDGLGTQ